jgi:hypothetical protein
MSIKETQKYVFDRALRDDGSKKKSDLIGSLYFNVNLVSYGNGYIWSHILLDKMIKTCVSELLSFAKH